MRVVGRSMSRRVSAASSERKRSDILKTEAFVDRRRESSARIENGEAVEGEEDVRASGARSD